MRSDPDVDLCLGEEHPLVSRRISFAQNAALGAYMYILEDGPELPKSSGPHAEEGGEILEGMHAQGCTKIEESRMRAYSILNNVITTFGSHEDPRGPVGMTAWREARASIWPATPRVPDQ